MIRFIDAARITPRSIESRLSYNFAEHLEFLMSGRCLETVYHNVDNLLIQRLVLLPFMGE